MFGRLAAEFERNLLEVAGGGLQDDLADLGRTGEGDLVDVGMLGDRAAGARSHAGDDVDDAFGNAGFSDQFAQAQGRQRSLLGGLQDDRVAAGQRGSELPCGHQEREIPRNNLAADADRLAQRVVEERGIGWVGLAVNLGAPSRRSSGRSRRPPERRRPCEKVSGLPLSRVSSSASSSACASMSSAILNR